MREQTKYDAVGNVLTASTTLPGGTNNRAFCYDEQNRVTWASTTSINGGPPCGGQIPSGTLSAAAYGPISFAYDTANRLTSSPTGTSIYDPHHVHAVDSIGTSYSAAYDAAGNMTCRAPSSSSLCTPSAQNGQLLTYDNEGRTTSWQNTPTNPTATEQMA
ncbi:MAG TPA: hypothetical protein VF120_08430 [Ktedonobacterales bacterium]